MYTLRCCYMNDWIYNSRFVDPCSLRYSARRSYMVRHSAAFPREWDISFVVWCIDVQLQKWNAKPPFLLELYSRQTPNIRLWLWRIRALHKCDLQRIQHKECSAFFQKRSMVWPQTIKAYGQIIAKKLYIIQGCIYVKHSGMWSYTVSMMHHMYTLQYRLQF